jgi:Tol biopolymer transport system component
VTYDQPNDSAPRWSADDRRIIYYSAVEDRGDIYEVAAGGTGQARSLASDAREKRPTHVSRDGQWILFNTLGGGNMDIGVWSAAEKRHRTWLSTPFHEQCAQLSPDGKWIAYQSDESGRWEIYVRAFPESDRKWLISNEGGTMPVWRPDGRELFYVSLDGKMTAVAVTAGADFETGAPVALFDAPLRQHATTQYDVANDGRFLLNRRVESVNADPITLLQNWDVPLHGKD